MLLAALSAAADPGDARDTGAAAASGEAAAPGQSPETGAPPAGPASSGPQKPPFEVTADEFEYQADRDVYVGRGHVVIVQEGKQLTADHVMFSNKTRQGVATGNVVVKDDGYTLKGPFIEFNVDDIVGVAFDSELDAANGAYGYRMGGREVRKTGPNTYEFVDGRFTTCRCPNETDRKPWEVRAQKASLDLDGYGRARNSTIDILGVPVMWFPYAVYPLSRDRQTGFLFPQGGQSRQSGATINVPFFWAPRDDFGAIFGAEYLEKRGFKPSADFEYVFGQRGSTELYGTFIRDKSIDPSSPTATFGDNRWGVTWRHRQDIPLDGWFAANVAEVSDNQFPFDFSDFRYYRRDRFLTSSALAGTSVGGASDRFSTNLSVLSTDDLENPDDQDRDNYLLQRLPEVQAAALPASTPFLPGLVASAGLEMINFERYGNPANSFSPALLVNEQFYDTGIDAIPTGQERNGNGIKVKFDAHRDDRTATQSGPERDGLFEEGEPLADHGQRVITHPRLSYPVHVANVVEIVPEAGYYGTFYASDLVGGDQRSLFTGRLDVQSTFRGSIDLPFGMGAATHVVQPYLGWAGVTEASQDDNPLFVPRTAVPQQRLRLLELDNITLDPADRIRDANDIVAGLRNRFLSAETGRLLGELSAYSEYQAAQAQWGPAVVSGQAKLPQGFVVRFHAVMDFAPASFSDGLFDFNWARGNQNFGIRYRYVRDIPEVFENFFRSDNSVDFKDNFKSINQVSGLGRWQATESWALTYAGSFSLDNAISLVNQFGIEYLSRCKCWAVRLEVDESQTQGFQWHLRYRLVGLGDQKQNLFSR